MPVCAKKCVEAGRLECLRVSMFVTSRLSCELPFKSFSGGPPPLPLSAESHLTSNFCTSSDFNPQVPSLCLVARRDNFMRISQVEPYYPTIQSIQPVLQTL